MQTMEAYFLVFPNELSPAIYGHNCTVCKYCIDTVPIGHGGWGGVGVLLPLGARLLTVHLNVPIENASFAVQRNDAA